MKPSSDSFSTEIERKFLVQGDAWKSGDATRMSQGYLCRDVGRTVRVRTTLPNGNVIIKTRRSC